MPGPQDKVVTVQANTCVVYTLQFSRDPSNPTGPITGTITARCNLSDGTTEQIVTLPTALAGALDTSVRNLMNGAALTLARQAAGIEAP